MSDAQLMREWITKFPFCLIVILPYLLSLVISYLFIFKPSFAIELQRKFYEKINWKIEPISLEKEIRNTRIMGVSLLVIAALTAVFLLINLKT